MERNIISLERRGRKWEETNVGVDVVVGSIAVPVRRDRLILLLRRLTRLLQRRRRIELLLICNGRCLLNLRRSRPLLERPLLLDGLLRKRLVVRSNTRLAFQRPDAAEKRLRRERSLRRRLRTGLDWALDDVAVVSLAKVSSERAVARR
jgi:hypothetical protein